MGTTVVWCDFLFYPVGSGDGDPELRVLFHSARQTGAWTRETALDPPPVKDLHEMNLTSNSEVKNQKNKSLTMEIRAGVTCGSAVTGRTAG